MPVLLRIFAPILLAIVLASPLVVLLNGMTLTKSGKVLFAPDFRFIKIKITELERISFIFNQWENNKYSARIKLIFKNGKTFVKDYSKQFRYKKNKLLLCMYTVTQAHVDEICATLLECEFCTVTVIDKNMQVTYQNI